MLELRNIHKSLGDVRVLNGVDICIEKPSIIFVTATTICSKTPEENLGLGYLSAVCRKNGIKLTVIDGWLEGLTSMEIVQRILFSPKPAFIGFSCNQLNGNTAIEVVQILKSKNYSVPFVAGGFGPTFYPEEFLYSNKTDLRKK